MAEGNGLLRAEEKGPCGRNEMTETKEFLCMACKSPLTPGVDYPRKTTKIFGVTVEPATPVVCWDAKACINRVDEYNNLKRAVGREFR